MIKSVVLASSLALIILATMSFARDNDTLQAQTICPPCRQSLEKYDDTVFVINDNQRVVVCCLGCANKMRRDWAGYLSIMTDELKEQPEQLARPFIIDYSNRGVCVPCMDGACELPQHLPK